MKTQPQKLSEGKQKLLRVSERFELPRVKLQSLYEGSPGEIDFGSSYRESTVQQLPVKLRNRDRDGKEKCQ